MEACCTIVVLGIVIFVAIMIGSSVSEANKKKQEKIQSLRNKFNGLKDSFYNTVGGFFNSEFGSYAGTKSSLSGYISQMESTNRELKMESKSDDYSSTISECTRLASQFEDFSKKVLQQPCTRGTRMMDPSNYGKINKEYFNTVRGMSKSTVDAIIAECEKNMSSRNYAQLFGINVETLLCCVWFYATEKPYSAEAFKRAVTVFQRVVERRNIDVDIAELYAMKQMGGEDVLRDPIRNRLKNSGNSVEELTLIASALMWINAYQVENMILQHMLSKGMQMTAKTQERLHSLTNGGGKAPSGFDVSSSANSMYFDVSSLAWKDDEYTGLFENLAFQEKTLSYSLAVRDEDKDLFITSGINVPGMPAILSKLNSVFADEYGNAVTATMKKSIALSGSGEENMEGILVESNECKQMGILIHVARIGKKLNIKFYTLFMPSGTRLADQKQQVLSLYKKLSPSVAMWESSMKDTTLMAIQQLLNAAQQGTMGSGADPISGDEPIF